MSQYGSVGPVSHSGGPGSWCASRYCQRGLWPTCWRGHPEAGGKDTWVTLIGIYDIQQLIVSHVLAQHYMLYSVTSVTYCIIKIESIVFFKHPFLSCLLTPVIYFMTPLNWIGIHISRFQQVVIDSVPVCTMWQLFCVCSLQRSSVIGQTMHYGGNRSSSGWCAQPGLWRNMASMPMPSCYSCLNTSPWSCVSLAASPWGSTRASPTPSFRLWWASAECSVRLRFSANFFIYLFFFKFANTLLTNLQEWHKPGFANK